MILFGPELPNGQRAALSLAVVDRKALLRVESVKGTGGGEGGMKMPSLIVEVTSQIPINSNLDS